MKKFALISLRNDLIIDRNERRDSIDTEIYNLVLELGYVPILLPNEPKIIEYFELIFKENNIGLVLLTGGNDIYKFKDNNNSNSYLKRDQTELNLIDYCIMKSIPILSICRGFQLITSYLGGNIEKIEGHINIKHKVSLINLKEDEVLNSVERIAEQILEQASAGDADSVQTDDSDQADNDTSADADD